MVFQLEKYNNPIFFPLALNINTDLPLYKMDNSAFTVAAIYGDQ